VSLNGVEGDGSDLSGKHDSQLSVVGNGMKWLLLDDAVRFRSLLQPGELVALHCPTVRR